MFIESVFAEKKRTGWIEVITGSMFSGKTEELLRRMRRAKIANQKYIILKPFVDNRYSESKVISHDKTEEPSVIVKSSKEILDLAKNIEVIGIDEVQFFDEKLPDICNKLAYDGKRVIAAGLDMDFMGRPFGIMPSLMAIAEFVTKVHAVCVKCGSPAYFSHRTTKSRKKVEVGAMEKYEPLCRDCYHNVVSEKG